jgi:hypothetical protein
MPQPPTWRTRVSLFVWVITFDLSSMEGPASSYATAGIALRIILLRKPHHYVKLEIPSVGMKFIIMQFSPRPFLISFWSKYPPQQCVLKNPQSMFLLQNGRPIFCTTLHKAGLNHWNKPSLLLHILVNTILNKEMSFQGICTSSRSHMTNVTEEINVM